MGDELAPGRGVERRKAFFDMRLHAAQRLGVPVGLFVARDGAEADRLAEACRSGLRIQVKPAQAGPFENP